LIKIKPIGKWRELKMLMENYDKRLEYAARILSKEAAEFLLEDVKRRSPKGKAFDAYRDSLTVVELKDRTTEYAVVSDAAKVRVRDIKKDEGHGMVIYVSATGAGMGKSLEMAMLIEQSNPWTIDLIPHGLKKETVSLIHRRVLKHEEEFAREQTNDFILSNRAALADTGARWGHIEDKKADKGNLWSMPDFMSLAVRAEFGINDAPHPHWRPAIKDLRESIQKIIDDSDKINGALYDSSFAEHMKSDTSVKRWSVRKFKKETDEFRKALGAR